MRAGMVLEALSAYYRVSVLIIPLYCSHQDEVSPTLRSLCEHSIKVLPSADPRERIKQAGAAYSDSRFDLVHVFRLSAMPYARPYMVDGANRPRRHLDLDDIDSKTHKRLAAICGENGDAIKAASEIAMARQSEFLETAAFRIFDRIYVCAEADLRELMGRCRAEVQVLPNAVRTPSTVRPPAQEGLLRMLFVGTLGYYPNTDAVLYFCKHILPLIRESAPIPVQVDIVGGGAPQAVHEVAAKAGIRLTGPVPDLQPYYDAAHAVIVPLRAGGGTRIKILEAFSYRRPVVTTSIGVEGIEARPNQEVLVGDTSEDFAAHCIQLITDRALAARLVENASLLLSRAYSAEALKRAVGDLLASEVPPESPSDASSPAAT